MAPHSSTLAWKIPWMAAVHGVAKSDMTERLAFTFHFHALEKEMGQGSLVGCRLWGCTEQDMTEVTQQQEDFGKDGKP